MNTSLTSNLEASGVPQGRGGHRVHMSTASRCRRACRTTERRRAGHAFAVAWSRGLDRDHVFGEPERGRARRAEVRSRAMRLAPNHQVRRDWRYQRLVKKDFAAAMAQADTGNMQSPAALTSPIGVQYALLRRWDAAVEYAKRGGPRPAQRQRRRRRATHPARCATLCRSGRIRGTGGGFSPGNIGWRGLDQSRIDGRSRRRGAMRGCSSTPTRPVAAYCTLLGVQCWTEPSCIASRR
jgi:hypothetical protein